MPEPSDWIATTGAWAVTDDEAGAAIPDQVLADPSLSLIAKGLLALLLAHKGQTINPYEDAFEDASGIAAAIDKLIDAGLAARLEAS